MSKKAFLIFRKQKFKKGFSCILAKVYSEPWYIQNPRHIQNTVKYLRWKKKKFSYFLIFCEMELSSSSIMEAFLIFPEMEAPKKNPYISAKGTFLYFRKQKL